MIVPEEQPPEYPLNETGESPLNTTHDVYELFEILSYLAGQTADIRLGTNICVVPLRHPVLLVKQALTLAELSGGMFEFGVGAGWLSTGLEALDVPPAERGSRLDEFLELYRQVLERGVTDFAGDHHYFDRVGFHPIPEGAAVPPV